MSDSSKRARNPIGKTSSGQDSVQKAAGVIALVLTPLLMQILYLTPSLDAIGPVVLVVKKHQPHAAQASLLICRRLYQNNVLISPQLPNLSPEEGQMLGDGSLSILL